MAFGNYTDPVDVPKGPLSYIKIIWSSLPSSIRFLITLCLAIASVFLAYNLYLRLVRSQVERPLRVDVSAAGNQLASAAPNHFRVSSPSEAFRKVPRTEYGIAPAEYAYACIVRNSNITCATPGRQTIFARVPSGKLVSLLNYVILQYTAPKTLALRTEAEFILQATYRSPPANFLEGEDQGAVGQFNRAVIEDLLMGRTYPTISARLTGLRTSSELVNGPADRVLTDLAPMRWIWKVKPLESGETILNLEVYWHLKFGDTSVPVEINFSREPRVIETTLVQRISGIVADINPIYTFAATILAALGGVAIWLRDKWLHRSEGPTEGQKRRSKK